MLKTVLLTLLSSSIYFYAFTQNQFKQVIRGSVKDKEIGSPLPGASVVLLDSAQYRGVSCDEKGNFRLNNVSVGKHNLKVSFIGYKEITIPVLVHSTKEVVLSIELEETVIKEKEIQVTANRDKFESNNKMTSASVMKYNTEEAFRYAGSMADPARMAMNYAGVTSASEMSNEIVIRGNSPAGLLWLLDDVEIPNPNHFASQGTTGGPISMLSNNVLSNSDFMTGAFPAEYNQALSGVFDLKLRSGNNEQHEYTLQAGILGLEATFEGPFSKKHRASYLINYRYSTMDILDKFIDLKISGVPRYQDLTTKIRISLGKGSLSFFSLSGTGIMALLDSEEKDGDFTADPKRENYYMGSDMAASGIAYNWLNKKKLNQKLLLSFYYQKMKSSVDTLNDLDEPFNVFYDKSNDNRISLKYTMSKKFSSRISVKSGFSAQKLFFNLDAKRYNDKNNEFISIVEDKLNVVDGPVLLTAYSQWNFKITEKFSIRAGLNLNYFTLTNKISPEPRLSFNYQINDLSSVYLAYGLHSKTAPLATLFAKTKISDNEFISTNNKLDFSKAQHIIAGYSRLISDNVRFKTECYYQYIYNVPVESHPSSFSLLNISNLGSGFGDLVADSLINRGTGYNYGIEFSLEKYFSSKFYYLVSVSLFQSRYTASDHVERNTEFNSNYIFNALGGKEFILNEGKALFFSLKAVFSGGKRYTPIDLELSKLYKKTVMISALAYSEQFEPYYKFDFKAGARFEQKRFSHEISVTVDNFTNHQNVFRQEYNAAKNTIITQYQLGIIPGFYYRVYF